MAKILVADDVHGIIKAMERILSADNHQIDTCSDGQQAINMIKDNKYDLIITDILMPEKDGLEVAKYVRGMDCDRKHTPILAITGGGTLVTSEMAIEAAKLNTNKVLVKPFDSKVFRQAVRQCLERD